MIKILTPEMFLKQERRASLKGRYKLQVLQGGIIVQETPWRRNLVNDNGMDKVATTVFCDLFKYCAVGTGTRVNNRNITVNSQVGTTVTAAGGANFTPSDVGRILHYASGADTKIVGYTSATVVTVANVLSITGQPATIFYVDELGLQTETRRSNTYLVGAGNCQTLRQAPATYIHRRTYDFPAEVGTVVYNEAGFSDNSSAGANLFSRVVISPGISVLASQQLRVIYELSISLSPAASAQGGSAFVSGWPIAPATDTAGTEKMEITGISSVANDGSTTSFDGTVAMAGGGDGRVMDNEPSVVTQIYLVPDATALLTWPANLGSARRVSVSTDYKACTLDSYSTGNFQRTRSATFAPNEAVGANRRSMGFGKLSDAVGAVQVYCVYRYLFNQAQTKLNTHTLTLTFSSIWTRDLS